MEGLRAQAPGATHYVVFDACRNELNLTRKGRKALSDKGFVPIAYTPGVLVAYATAPGRTATDIGSDGGPYAKALAEEIVKPGVDSMLVFTRVARRVQREIGQDPFLSASTMPEVYFAAEIPDAPKPNSAQPEAQSNEAAVAWSAIKDTNNIAILESFVARYKGSFYAELARARVEELKKQRVAVAAPPTAKPEPPVGSISGAGATFPYPIYAKWGDAYKKVTGNGLAYQPIGSGGGIKQIQARTVTFGATDVPLTAEQLESDGLLQFPTVMGGIVPIVNLQGVKAGELQLDGPALAKIFLGEIRSWDDAGIKRLNPSAKIPSQAITVVHRSDGSGTTFNWTLYLSRVSADWRAKVGTNTSVSWPVGIDAKGNQGVATEVTRTIGSIGYVEYAFAKQYRIAHASLINKEGKRAVPSVESFQSAAAHAEGLGSILIDQPGAQSWPITSATYVLMSKTPADPIASARALRFFEWSMDHGGGLATELDYTPMPKQTVELIKNSWTQIIGPDGNQVYRRR